MEDDVVPERRVGAKTIQSTFPGKCIYHMLRTNSDNEGANLQVYTYLQMKQTTRTRSTCVSYCCSPPVVRSFVTPDDKKGAGTDESRDVFNAQA